MSDADQTVPGGAPAVRRRLSADERRRQLVAIGLAKIVETPIQDLSMDDIATEAGISRGLLFHYFPTKTDFYLACIAAAGRRMLRTTALDERATGEEQVETVTRLMIEHTRNLVEPAGAAPLAAAMKLADRLRGKRIALVASGGNISPAQLAALYR